MALAGGKLENIVRYAGVSPTSPLQTLRQFFRSSFVLDAFELFLWEMKIDLPDLVDDLVDDDGGELLQLILSDFEEWLEAGGGPST